MKRFIVAAFFAVSLLFPAFAFATTALWGETHDVAIEEDTPAAFTANWTGTGSIVASGDDDKIVLGSGQYMYNTTPFNTGAGWFKVRTDKYTLKGSGSYLVKIKKCDDAACDGESWEAYTPGTAFYTAGYVQILLTEDGTEPPSEVAFVQSKGNANTSTSISAAFDSGVTAGNLLIAVVCRWDGIPTNGQVTDSRADNTWVRQYEYHDGSNHTVAVFSCIAQSSGAMTVTYNPGTSHYNALSIAEFENVSSPTAEDSSGGTDNASPYFFGTVDISGDGLLIGSLMQGSTDDAVTENPANTWTTNGAFFYNNGVNDYIALTSAYDLVSAGTYGTAATDHGYQTGTSRYFIGVLVSFR